MIKRQATALAVVGVAFVAACTAAPQVEPSPEQASPTQAAGTGQPHPVALTATLTDDGCNLNGALSFDPGPVRIDVDNQDPTDRASFQLLRIGPGETFESFEQHVAEEQSRIDAGEGPIGFSDDQATEVTGTLLEAGGQDQLKATLAEGRYVLVCADWADGAATDGKGRLIVAGRLMVAAPGPAARGYAMMADLPAEPGVVLLGGATRPGRIDLSDMWTFTSEGGWREITPAAVPELTGSQFGGKLVGTTFAFHTPSGVAVFVDIKGNPWTYDPATNNWTDKPSGVGPTALLGAAMAYDSASDRMIVFGGLDPATFGENNETWAYEVDASTWERMHPRQSPSPRNFPAMAYDAESDRVILFGGAPGEGLAVGDTWAYDYESDEWTEMSPSSAPPARTLSGMAYDPDRRRIVLFGGSRDGESASHDDVWEYDLGSNRWTDVSPPDGPGARAWHAMAYDEESGVIVVFGGGESRSAYTAETWLLDPTAASWRQAAE